MATGFVVFVNLLLRPIVSFINRQPLMSTELEIGYLVAVTCRSQDEAHIRALLLQGLAGGDWRCAASTATMSRVRAALS